jgi:hypothetical protein
MVPPATELAVAGCGKAPPKTRKNCRAVRIRRSNRLQAVTAMHPCCRMIGLKRLKSCFGHF